MCLFSCDAGSVVLSEVLEGLALPFHILSADDDVEEFVWEMLVHHFMDAVAIFGGDDTNLGSSLFQGFQHCNGFGEELGIGGHMYVRFFHIFFL